MHARTKVFTGVAASIAAGALALITGLGPAQASVQTRTTAVSTQAVAAAEAPEFTATPAKSFDTFDANQGIAVDGKYFYAVNNRTITKHDKVTGKPLLQFAGVAGGPIIHMDSGSVVNGKLYVATSNYNQRPMQSSIEVFDPRTMRPIATHSFGIERGSMTWLDRHDGAWWGGFANYDRPPAGETEPYGKTENTQVVKMDDNFNVTQSWTIPATILDRFKPMSNSGGSWGPDGRLWLTGHDLDEAYVMNIPKAASELEWAATVKLPGVEGQAIAWDRSAKKPTLWAIKRSTSQALSFDVPVASISDPSTENWRILGPGHFEQ